MLNNALPLTAVDERCRVLLVTTTVSEGGAERFVATVASALDHNRFDVEIAALRPIVDYSLPVGTRVHDLGKRKVWDNLTVIVRLRRLIQSGDYHVVLGALSTTNILLLPTLALLRKRPAWIAFADSDPRPLGLTDESGWKRAVERYLLGQAWRKADRIMCNSKGSEEALASLIPQCRHRLTILFNPVDFEAMDAMAKEPAQCDALDLDRPIVITAVRLERTKRLDIALRAFATILASGVPGHLVLCGEGSQRQPLEALAATLGIGDRVTFLGFVRNPFAEMRAADIFVLSSDREGLPNALIEAQGLGLPAVSTDCHSGPREIIEHNVTGALVPTNDPHAFARALGDLMSDPDKCKRFGAMAAQRARERFDLSRHLSTLEHMLTSTKARR